MDSDSKKSYSNWDNLIKENFENPKFQSLISYYAWKYARIWGYYEDRQEAANDLRQDAFLKAWEKRDSFDGKYFFAWVRQIMLNRAKDLSDQKKIKPQDQKGKMPDTSGEKAFDTHEYVDLVARADQCLEKLKAENQEIFLRRRCGYSYEEIKDILDQNFSVANLRKKHCEAKLSFKGCMDEV